MHQNTNLHREQSLSRLIELAKGVHMSDAQRAEQRNSFVYGNTRIENENVTLEMVEKISKGMTLPSR
jgi:hypothetical protein